MLPDPRDNPPDAEPIGAQLRRRRAAAARLPQLHDGRRDPLELPRQPTPDVRELDSWACALAHLRDAGLAGLPPASVRRAMASHGDRYAAVLPKRPAA